MEIIKLATLEEMNKNSFVEEVEHQLGVEGVAVIDGPGLCQDTATFRGLAEQFCGPLSKNNPEHVRLAEDETASVNRPTPFSNKRKLLWHNENTFARQWPARIAFGCQQAAVGGDTPTVDMSQVTSRLPVETQKKFLESGVTYKRRLGMGLGLDWRTVYQTQDPLVAEKKCRENGAEFEWQDGEDVLVTSETRPAITRHPLTGRLTFVAQILHWHPDAMDEDVRSALELVYGRAGFPKSCSFGDGTLIPAEVIQAIIDACAELEEVVPWQTDRVMVVDNLRRSHARNPFKGERKLLVALGQGVDYSVMAGVDAE